MRTLEAANAGQNGPAIVGLVEVGITTPTTVLRPRQAGVSEVVLVEAQHQRRRQKQKHDGYHGQESHLSVGGRRVVTSHSIIQTSIYSTSDLAANVFF